MFYQEETLEQTQDMLERFGHLAGLGAPSVFPKTSFTGGWVEVVHLCLNCSPCDLDPYKVDAWMDIE